MKFLPLLWSGMWRKPARTALILLQVTVAFCLFGVLQGMKTGVERAASETRADVLFVAPDAFGGAPLPFSYSERLKSIPGVKAVTVADGLLGTYQKPDQPVYVLDVDPQDFWLTLMPEILKVHSADLQALRRTRTGVLISEDIGRKYGWHIGDRIPLTSTTLQSNGSGDWAFQVVGMFTPHEIGGGGYIVGNYSYFDEARAQNRGTVRNFYVVVNDPRQAAEVAEAIDRTFANSPNATGTGSFRENAQQQLQAIGNLDFAIRSIVAAVLVALLFSISTMMMQTIRERTPELAVLKTLGFTDRLVLFMVFAEAVVLCVLAAILGLALAMLVFPYAAKFIPGLSMPWIVMAAGLLGAVLVALVSASVPGMRAARLEVVDALAGR